MFTGCVETEYHNNYAMIISLARRIQSHLGGRLEDFEEVATTWLFMKAIKSFNPTKGKKFSSHLYKVVWDDLYSLRRMEIRRAKRCPIKTMNIEDISCTITFRFNEFLEDLTADAQALVHLAINPPDSIIIKKDCTPRMDSLRKYTIKKMKWNVDQFYDAVEEIRTAL